MTDRDYGYEAQKAAEKHLEALDDVLYYEGEGDVPEVESAGPYCGCTTCQVRETLWIAWPLIEEYVRNNPEPLSRHSELSSVSTPVTPIEKRRNG